MLFFRDQDITTEQHLAFGGAFWPLEVHPFSDCKLDYPEVLAITHGQNNRWCVPIRKAVASACT